MPEPDIRPADPFELPGWVGDEGGVWSTEAPLEAGALVVGTLRGAESGSELAVALWATDIAAPRPSCPVEARVAAHAAWQRGQVELFEVDGVLACAVPTTMFTADLACEAIRRLAKTVGAEPSKFRVLLAL